MSDNEAIPEDPQNIHLLKSEKREENMQSQSRFELWRGAGKRSTKSPITAIEIRKSFSPICRPIEVSDIGEPSFRYKRSLS
jgi:hypothetical protein